MGADPSVPETARGEFKLSAVLYPLLWRCITVFVFSGNGGGRVLPILWGCIAIFIFAGNGREYVPFRADNPCDDHDTYTRETGGDPLHGRAPSQPLILRGFLWRFALLLVCHFECHPWNSTG